MKRIADVVIVVAAAPLWFPLLIVVGVLVWRRIGRPVLFRQNRPGKDERIFELIKFRTMANGYGADGQILPDAARLTPFGRWLRATSLDELPELINVLRGEMSLVGPRPLLVHYLERYSQEQRKRHSVRPGITGWAQVNGRNSVDWDARFNLDIWYIQNQTFWLDCKILCITALRVIQRRGITAQNSVTMPEFQGKHLSTERAMPTNSEPFVSQGEGKQSK